MDLIPWRRKRERNGDRGESENAMAQFRSDMETLFDRFFQAPWGDDGFEFPFGGLAAPRADLADAENEITLSMELPGVDPKEVDINIAGGVLTVRGEKHEDKEEKNKSYQFTERRFGGFQRSVALPSTVDPDKVDAKFKNGVLTVRVAKRADSKPKRIKVRSA